MMVTNTNLKFSIEKADTMRKHGTSSTANTQNQTKVNDPKSIIQFNFAGKEQQ